MTQRKIIEAAMSAFASSGFDGASIREIAKSAGVAHGLIRHHFGSKEDLWCAVVDYYLARLSARHQPLFLQIGEAEPVDLLKGFVRNYVRVAAENPQYISAVLMECKRSGPRLDYFMKRALPVHRAVDPVFKAVQEQGLLLQFTSDSFLLFLISLGSFPFTLGALNERLTRVDLSSPEGIVQHTELVVQVLFGEASA